MNLTANLELLIKHLNAEVAVLEARLASVMHQVELRAKAAGVEMPTAPVSSVPPQANVAPSTLIPVDHSVAQAQQPQTETKAA